ncbi:MAG: DinB family protein [Acidobacteria bacterium]|nr:DinB family protein [Acidobacteriota bacterium]
MKRLFAVLTLAMLIALPIAAQAQPPAPSAAPAATAQAAPAGPTEPLSRVIFNGYNAIKRNLTESAAKVPEADYSFQPTKDVRNFAQMFDHVANSQFSYCAAAKGEANPNKDDFEKTATTKAAAVKALADSFAYCDTVYGTLTDAKALEMIKVGQNESPRAGRLIANTAHLNEHYGNLVTMMRLKGMVPPSTERAQQIRK